MIRTNQTRRVVTTVVLTAGVLGLSAGQALAASLGPSDFTKADALTKAYGDDFTNGDITATRVDLTVLGAGYYSARAIDSSASLSQGLGYLVEDGDLEEIFALSDSEPIGDAAGSFTAEDPFELIRFSPDGDGDPISSDPSQNPLGELQMVAYEISGAGIDKTTWLVFTEDLVNFDADYNDLIFEVTLDGLIPAVPSPAAGLGGLALLGMMIVGRQVRHRRTA